MKRLAPWILLTLLILGVCGPLFPPLVKVGGETIYNIAFVCLCLLIVTVVLWALAYSNDSPGPTPTTRQIKYDDGYEVKYYDEEGE
jgi:hypothetical protein